MLPACVIKTVDRRLEVVTEDELYQDNPAEIDYEQHFDMHSHLFNLTDVLYYISIPDIYAMANTCNDGVFAVGTMHMPVYLDSKQHLIQVGDRVEGSVALTIHRDEQKHIDYERTYMTMNMKGNEHIYHHNLRYYPYTRREINLLPMNNTETLIKLHVVQRYELGGTEYLRFKLIKISRPEASDMLVANYPEWGGTDNTLRSTLDFLNTQRLAINNLRLGQDAAARRQARYAAMYEFMYNNWVVPLLVILEGQAQNNDEMLIRSGNRAIMQKDDDIIIATNQKGIIFNSFTGAGYGLEATLASATDIKKISQKLLNKVQAKMLQYPIIDSQSIKDTVTYISQQEPELDISTDVIAVIYYCLKKLAVTEGKIKIMNCTEQVKYINNLKKNSVTILPTSFTEALKANCATTYIKYKICNALGWNKVFTGEETSLNFC